MPSRDTEKNALMSTVLRLTSEKEALQERLQKFILTIQATAQELHKIANSLARYAIHEDICLSLYGTLASESSPTAKMETHLDTNGHRDTKATRPRKLRKSSTSGEAKQKARPPARGLRPSTRPGVKGARTLAELRRLSSWVAIFEQVVKECPGLTPLEQEDRAVKRWIKQYGNK